jgi:hypothetical protein
MLCSFISFGQYAYDQELKSKSSKIKFAKYLSDQYGSPTTKMIFNSQDKKDVLYYTNSPNVQGVLEDFATIIHEFFHSTDTDLTTNSAYSYGVNQSIRIEVPATQCFESSEINNMLSQSLRDSVFRYGLYMGNDKVLSGGLDVQKEIGEGAASVKQGIYGILEEYFAYKNGFNAQLDLFGFYNSLPQETEDLWKDYFTESNNGTIAFYEFQLFVSWYLVYAKEHHKDQYDEILNNKPLRVAFTLLHDEFLSSINRLHSLRATKSNFQTKCFADLVKLDDSHEDLIAMIKLSGLSEHIKDSTFVENGESKTIQIHLLPEHILSQVQDFYKKTQNSIINTDGYYPLLMYHTGVDDQTAYLKKLFNTKLKNHLNSFKIKGCTTENYQDYLE